ncbi:MAG: ABC transporter permease [Anaerolineae bacterium]|nr:ABC transporter permease [Anaerolineae bacterium]
MRSLLRLRAIVIVAVKRLLAQPLLSLALTIGLTVAVALMLTVPIYAESVAFRVLEERLNAQANESSRPPFSLIIQYAGSWYDPVNWEDTLAVDDYIRTDAAADLGLDVQQVIQHVETENFRLYPGDEENYQRDKQIEFVTFGTIEQIEHHIELVEGTFPVPTDPAPDSVIEVMITEQFASEVGIQVGELYQGYNWRVDQNDSQQIRMVRVVGVWRARDEADHYWFYGPTMFNDILLVPRETFVNRIAPYTDIEVNLSLWYLISNGEGITTSRVDAIIQGHETVSKTIDQLLTKTQINKSPVQQLRPYQRSVRVLTLLLTAFSIPIFILLLIFIVMVIGLSVEQRGIETAVHRSRGTSPFQVMGLAVVEGLILGIIALIAGAGVAAFFTRLLGSVRSFMDFSGTNTFRVSFPPTLTLAAGAALLLSVLIYLIPTISAARHTIISYKQAKARTSTRPLWQRMGLDILLLALVGYFYYRLVQQGSLFVNQSGETAVLEDAYSDPLLYMLPSATVFALTLFALRFLPLIMRFISWLLQLTDNVGLLIVTRQLERAPQSYYLPSILLICTIGLGTFMASFARTIDRYLYEQQFYRYAADVEIRVFNQPQPLFGGYPTEATAPVYMHIAEFNDMPYIERATRLGEYSATAKLSTGSWNGKFIGVDRADFGAISFWRFDFTDYRLGYLLNALATQNDTVLVSRDVLESTSLQEGDFIRLEVRSYSDTIPVELQIVGVLDYFPRWFPQEDGPLFVGNLDYLFEQAGGELSHVVLARASDDFDNTVLTKEILSRGADGVTIKDPFQRIERAQAQPERQGLFGMLSIGFIASSLVTVLGFFLYTLFSYQRRIVELGILRAVGLSKLSMIFSVAWELCLLIVSGLGLGVGLGLAVSGLYIPFLQFSTDRSELVPPYVVEIAWTEIAQITVLFLATFITILVLLLVVLGRMRIFEAVKLGETV